jgi:hypothetical protein
MNKVRKSRSDGRASSRNRRHDALRLGMMAVLLAFPSVLFLDGSNAANASHVQKAAEQRNIAVESFQVLELPINITNVSLMETDKGYLLKCSLANSSDNEILGLRYLLLLVDSNNVVRTAVARSEGFKLAGYAIKSVTFRNPLKLKLKRGVRLELMLEQVVGYESIWEVLKARQTLEAYSSGDYSMMPQVLRVSNQVDVPLLPLRAPRIIY